MAVSVAVSLLYVVKFFKRGEEPVHVVDWFHHQGLELCPTTWRKTIKLIFSFCANQGAFAFD